MRVVELIEREERCIMSDPGFILLTIIALCLPLFGSIIYFGLKSRKANLDKWLKETNARSVQSQISANQLDVCSLLYGNLMIHPRLPYHSSSTTAAIKTLEG